MSNWMPIWPQHGTAKPSDNTSQMYRHTCMAQNWLDFPFSSSAAIYPTAPCGWKTLIVRLFSISFSKSSLVLDVDKACFHFIVLSLGCLRMLESMEPHLTWSTKFTSWLIPTRHSWKGCTSQRERIGMHWISSEKHFLIRSSFTPRLSVFLGTLSLFWTKHRTKTAIFWSWIGLVNIPSKRTWECAPFLCGGGQNLGYSIFFFKHDRRTVISQAWQGNEQT